MARGLTLEEIAKTAREPDLHKVSQMLSTMQRERVVEVADRKYRLAQSGLPSLGQSRAAVSAAAAPRGVKPRSASRAAGAGKAAVATARYTAIELHVAHEREKDTLRPGVKRGGALNQSALFDYFAECLKAEEKVDVLSPLDDIDRRFVPVRVSGDWWPAPSRTTKMYLAVSLLPAGFQETIAKANNSGVIHLGYPLDVFQTRDGSFWVNAVGTFAYRWKSDGNNRIELQAIDNSYVLNPAWVKAQKKFVDIAALLRRLDVADADGDEDTEGSSSTADIELEDLCLALDLAFARRKIGTIAACRMAADLTAEKGIQNVAALFAVSKARFSERAIADVKLMADRSRRDQDAFSDTALGTILGSSRVEREPDIRVTEPVPLTSAQLDAARKALCDPLTVITGPPGTGKSQVVSAIIASALMAGKSVLFASRNHAAIDAVENLARDVSPDRALLLRLNRKFGDDQPMSLSKIVSDLVSRPLTRPDFASAARQADTLKALDRKREDQVVRARDISDLRKKLEDLEDILESRLALLQLDAASVRALPPVGHQGARNVGQGLIARLLARVRFAIDRITHRRLPPEWIAAGCPASGVPHQREWLRSLTDARETLDAIPRLLAIYPSDEAQAELGRAIADMNKRITSGASKLCQTYLAALDYCDEDDRTSLMELRGKLSGGRTSPDEARLVLRHYPVWACSNLVVSKFAPLHPGFFDYVVIDEASQCDIASAIPLLARGKRAVIVGDPMQLRAISKLSREWEVDILQKLGLASNDSIGRYRQSMNSLFDLASTTHGASRSMLVDHFRCHPAIADYVGEFYSGGLVVQTDETSLRPPRGMKPGFAWIDVAGDVTPATSGVYCDAERDTIVDEIKSLERDGYRGTIGVCTPFRAQATRISDRIAESCSAEFVERVNFVSQTAHGFQGDARDVIFFSLCVGPNLAQGSQSFLREGGNLFNVAVSRARAVCRVVGNRDAARASGIGHIVRLVSACEKMALNEATILKFESPWEEKFFIALQAQGIECTTQYAIAGRRLDLAWFGKNDLKIDIEVDGDRYHRDASGMRKADDIWRDHQLRGLGWKVARFWVYELREDMERCVNRIRGLIDEAA